MRPSSRTAIIASNCSSNDRPGLAVAGVEEPQVDRVQLFHPERAQVVEHAGSELLGPPSWQPSALVVALRADLADQGELVGERMQGLPEQLVGHVGSVVLRCIDVIDPELRRPTDHGQCLGPIPGRPEHARPWQLHCAEADPVHPAATEVEGPCHKPKLTEA
jgi:hypothetical protein